MDITVEELQSKLQELLLKMDEIAQNVNDKKLDSFEGFMQSEKYRDEIVQIGNQLKERGIDITQTMI